MNRVKGKSALQQSRYMENSMRLLAFKYMEMCKIVTAVVVCVLLFISVVHADQEQRIEEIKQRLEELSHEASGCGGDMARLDAIMKEMQALSQELEQLYGAGSGEAGTPSMANHAAADAAAKKALAGMEDDPCYNCKYQKEYARAQFGSTLPWIRCIPVYFYLTWKVDETYYRHSGFPNDRLQYTLEESYSGCLHMVYDQKTQTQVESFLLSGPLPQKNSVVTAQLKKVSFYALSEAYGVPSDYRPVSTNSLDHFRVDIDHLDTDLPDPSIEFVYESFPADVHGSFAASRIYPIDEKFVKDPYHLRAGVPESISGSVQSAKGSLSLAELKKGLQEGELEKDFSLDYTINYPMLKEAYERKGTVTIKILFDRQPGRLVVTPDKGFKSSGPDCDEKFNPDSKTFTLKNTGESDISYAVQKKAKWLTLSKKNGTLAPKQSVCVTVTVNEKAKDLKDGEYTEAIEFINKTDGKGTTARKVLLDVGEEQKWRLFLTGFEKREYKIPKWRTANNKAIYYGGRFNYKLRVEFTIKKKKGKWTYKNGTITIAEVGYGTLYDTEAWEIRNQQNKFFSRVAALKGNSIGGKITGNKLVLSWDRPTPPPLRELEARIKFPCTPMPDCKKWGKIQYASEQFFLQTCYHKLTLEHGWTSPLEKPFVRGRSDELCWLRYNYTLRRICPK